MVKKSVVDAVMSKGSNANGLITSVVVVARMACQTDRPAKGFNDRKSGKKSSDQILLLSPKGNATNHCFTTVHFFALKRGCKPMITSRDTTMTSAGFLL